jgi:hypothetical protein
MEYSPVKTKRQSQRGLQRIRQSRARVSPIQSDYFQFVDDSRSDDDMDISDDMMGYEDQEVGGEWSPVCPSEPW